MDIEDHCSDDIQFSWDLARAFVSTMPIHHKTGIKITIKTFGCAHNVSDTEYMLGSLLDKGYDAESDFDFESNIVIINTCTVKDPSESHAVSLARKCLEKGIFVIIGGCIPQAERGDPSSFPNDIKYAILDCKVVFLGVREVIYPPELCSLLIACHRMFDSCSEALSSSARELLSKRAYQHLQPSLKQALHPLTAPTSGIRPFIIPIPIQTGCLGHCTYCKTIFARSRLQSYPLTQIVSAVRRAVLSGAVEVWFVGEDVGAWSKDFPLASQSTVPHLIHTVLTKCFPPLTVAQFAGLEYTPCRLRIGMTNPQHIFGLESEWADVLSDPRVFCFNHLPYQSGSNEVLKAMKRDYTIEKCIESWTLLQKLWSQRIIQRKNALKDLSIVLDTTSTMASSSIVPSLDDVVHKYNASQSLSPLIPIVTGPSTESARLTPHEEASFSLTSSSLVDFLKTQKSSNLEPSYMSSYDHMISSSSLHRETIVLSTDIIVGFTGESEGSHEQSKELLKLLRPQVVNTARYSRRKGTIGATLPNPLSGKEMKRRSREMNNIVESVLERSDLDGYVIHRARIVEICKDGKCAIRTQGNLQVVFENDGDLKIGDYVNVEIVRGGRVIYHGVLK
ncbi:hypothetical protein ADUPG1_014628 [Aduncisulcus paluster]|uniref:MTTase N-terminal domain-containing protein n=11 Tax=Aduncisulcus paluster TaxID=2918883 RepID=A0ABQ5JU79_9EUKA|nr:hypothetical protein ADUPG1_014628 [Aduncisulcus paluster]